MNKRSTGEEPFRVLAIVSAFNEADIIEPVIRHLAENGIDVYLIDNGSTDATVELAGRWLGRGLVDIEHRPPKGDSEDPEPVSWQEILERKIAVTSEVAADWYIHHDADEIRETPWPNVTLRDGIQWVDELGYNAIDFRVLNFPPVDDGFEPGADPSAHFVRYEDAAEYDRVQIKAWKSQRGEVVLHDGGHEVRLPDRRVFPIQFLLRHYPIRGQVHGLRKVLKERKQRFVESEHAKGWHIQYDGIADANHNFLRNPAELMPFALDEVKLELQVPAERAAGRRSDFASELTNVEGALDRADETRIAGWAHHREISSRRLNVEIWDGARLIDVVGANRHRPDLERAGLGDGRFAFALPTPPDLFDGRHHWIWASVAGSRRALRNSPIVFRTETRTAPSVGPRVASSGPDPIQSFWMGRLSTLERVSIASFLANGHQFQLYSYEDLDGVPPGVERRDANEILPRSSLFLDDRGTYATFASLFRYHLLYGRGGWWVDTDVVCLRPFEFGELVLGLEPDGTLATAVVRAPAGSELMRRAVAEASKIEGRPRPWGVIGPALMGRLADELEYLGLALGPEVFCPIDWADWELVVDPGLDQDLIAKSHAVHLWNSLWDLNGRDKDASYRHDCLYEQLKRKYLSKIPAAPKPLA